MQLSLREIGVSFGHRVLFDSVSFSLNEGDSLAVMGPSGVGKSTLLSVIAGLTNPTHGEVCFDYGLSLGRLEYLMQSAPLLVRRSVIDNVCLARRIQGPSLEVLDEDVSSILARLGLEAHAMTPVYKLSGGERQRVAVARTAILRPDILLADEPTASLDAWSRDVVMDVLLEPTRPQGIVIVSTHDPAVADKCSRVLRLSSSAVELA